MAEGSQKGKLGELPDGGLDRVRRCLSLAWDKLDGEAKAKLSALQEEDTLWTLALIVVVWAGFQLLPVSWLVDAIFAIVAGVAITADVAELLGGVVDAAQAGDEAALDRSASRVAKGLVGIGVDVVAGLIGGAAFGAVRRAVRGLRSTKATAGLFGSAGSSAVVNAAAGAAVGIAAVKAAPVASQSWKQTKRVLNWALPVAGGVTLAIGLWAVTKRAKRGDRS